MYLVWNFSPKCPSKKVKDITPLEKPDQNIPGEQLTRRGQSFFYGLLNEKSRSHS